MTLQTYGSFVAFAVVLILVPGPDFAVVTRNALAGRWRGAWAGVGVTCSNALQGIVAALGLGALITESHTVFSVVKWAGVAYLVYLGVQSLRSALRGSYPADVAQAARLARSDAWTGWRQGFLSNITNPKVLVFYLAVLPQFLTVGASVPATALLALTHAGLGLGYLLLLAAALDRARRVLSRRRVRRALDAGTGTVLIGFGARLAVEQA